MIVEINLLPWREKRRQKSKKLFVVGLVSSAISALLCIAIAWWYFQEQISQQQSRNAYLQSELVKFNQKIEKIEAIKKLREDLTERMKMIDRLQKDRSIVVYIFDIMNDILPSGVYLNNISKEENNLQLIGVTDSNNQISKLMRSINNTKETAWFRGAVLHEIKHKDKKNVSRLNDFRLTLTLDPSEAQQDMPEISRQKGQKNGT